MTGDTAMRGHANIADMAESFAFVGVGQMDLNNRHRNRFDRIVQRDRRVRVGPRVEQHGLCPHRMRFVQPINQMAFMVGLAEINVEPQGLCLIVQPPSNIVERIGAINLRLARAEQVEVRSVKDKNDVAIGQRFLAVELALGIGATLYSGYRKGETK
jgi:hypothetical protein